MKSLLVDAMREANKDENGAALSDSGSFDTTSDQFSETANDSVVDAPLPIADDLQLLDPEATDDDTASVDDVAVDTDPVISSAIESRQSPSAGELSAQVAILQVAKPVAGKSPSLSRFSPAICLALFLVAGVAWSGWQTWHAQLAGSDLGATRTPGAQAQFSTIDADANSRAQRFPFIGPSGSLTGAEAEQ